MSRELSCACNIQRFFDAFFGGTALSFGFRRRFWQTFSLIAIAVDWVYDSLNLSRKIWLADNFPANNCYAITIRIAG